MISTPAHPGLPLSRLLLVILLAVPPIFQLSAHAQQHPAAASPSEDDAEDAAAQEDFSQDTPEQIIQQSWQMLTEHVQDSKHFESRIQALSALSNLGSNPRSNHLIAEAMSDPSLDVRTAAILAAGNSKSRALIPQVEKLLNDPEPQVVFVAATTLWRQFKDKSGEDILADIAGGERKANPGLLHGATHDMSRTLHSPSAMEKLGLTTGAGLVLGPFGFSIAAVEYARKNGSDSARIQAINLLTEEKTEDLREQMKSLLSDKDPGVRATAARVLGSFHHQQDAAALTPLLDDSKLPVRLAAAAAYIECLSASPKGKLAQPHTHPLLNAPAAR